jgi:hypothetical protein
MHPSLEFEQVAAGYNVGREHSIEGLLSFRHLVKWAWQRLLLKRCVGSPSDLPEVRAFSSRFDAVIGAG